MAEESSAAVIEPKQKPRQEKRRKPKRQPRYQVILWDDDDHTYAYVMVMLRDLFGHTLESGYELARQVDTRGKAIVLTTTLEHAELKRDQIHAYGKDGLIDRCAGSMYSTIEAMGD